MHFSCVLAFLTSGLTLGHATGLAQHQTLLSPTDSRIHPESTTINFDDLPTNLTTGLGPSNSFTYRNLTFKSFLIASIPVAITQPSPPWNIHEVFCLGSAPNVIVGSRSNSSNLWPTISSCSLSEDSSKNECHGTFNVVSFRIRPMGIMPGPSNGVRFVVVNIDFLKSSQFKTDHTGEDLPVTILDDPDILPPLKPGFPPRDPTKTVFGLFMAWFRPGAAPSSRVDMRRFRPGFATGIDTMQIYGYTYPVPGSDVEVVDWPFCIDDLEVEFNPEEDDGLEVIHSEGDKNRVGVWREQIYF